MIKDASVLFVYTFLPFALFSCGYVAMGWIFYTPSFAISSVVGLQVHQGLPCLSQHKLNVRILAEKEDADLPAGTILSQMPQGGQRIKSNQSVFLVVSQKPPTAVMPSLVKKPLIEVQQLLKTHQIPYACQYLPGNYPQDVCLAQVPAAGQPIQGPVTVYVCAGETAPFLFAQLVGLRLEDALEVLSLQGIEPELFYANPENTDLLHAYVVRQQPAAGTMVYLDAECQPRVQLYLSDKSS